MASSSDDEHSIGGRSRYDGIYYGDDSDYYDDMEIDPIVATRGPFNQGTETFENHIVYGDYMVLSERRCKFLEKQVSRLKPQIPFYVCQITLSMVDLKKPKMYFSQDYTQKFLKDYLSKDRLLCVTHEYRRGFRQVKLAMGKHDGCAFITLNWGIVVREAQLLDGEMAIFWFKEKGDGLSVNMWSGIPLPL